MLKMVLLQYCDVRRGVRPVMNAGNIFFKCVSNMRNKLVNEGINQDSIHLIEM